jgi:hypothetical protein
MRAKAFGKRHIPSIRHDFTTLNDGYFAMSSEIVGRMFGAFNPNIEIKALPGVLE